MFRVLQLRRHRHGADREPGDDAGGERQRLLPRASARRPTSTSARSATTSWPTGRARSSQDADRARRALAVDCCRRCRPARRGASHDRDARPDACRLPICATSFQHCASASLRRDRCKPARIARFAPLLACLSPTERLTALVACALRPDRPVNNTLVVGSTTDRTPRSLASERPQRAQSCVRAVASRRAARDRRVRRRQRWRRVGRAAGTGPQAARAASSRRRPKRRAS